MQTTSDIKGKKMYEQFLLQRGKTKDYTFTKDEQDRVDLITYDGIESAVTELKMRVDFASTDKLIQNDGCMIEEAKLNHLLQTNSISGYSKAYYVMTFSDNVMYIYDIIKHKDEILSLPKKQRWCNKTTEFGKSHKVLKDVRDLPLKYAHKFVLTKVNEDSNKVYYEWIESPAESK